MMSRAAPTGSPTSPGAAPEPLSGSRTGGTRRARRGRGRRASAPTLPASTSSSGADGALRCSRSTACRPGRACRRSLRSTSPMPWSRRCWPALRAARGSQPAAPGPSRLAGQPVVSDVARAHRRGLRGRLPRRDRGAEARQRPCLRRRAPHDGGGFPRQRPRLGTGRSSRRGSPVGERILGAVEATRSAVGTNTNLGIVLLARRSPRQPKAPATFAAGPVRGAGRPRPSPMRARPSRRSCSPSRAGSARPRPTMSARPAAVTLLEAMRAGRRPRPHRPPIRHRLSPMSSTSACRRWPPRARRAGMWPTVACLYRLSPDLPRQPRRAQARAAGGARRCATRRLPLRGPRWPAATKPPGRGALLAFDASLKARGINPGTTADLTVACLLVHNLLAANLHKPGVGA